MLEKALDGLKGLAKLVAIIVYGLGYIIYTPSKWVLELKMSSEIKAEKLKLEEEAAKEATKKTVKKRAPRKKKVAETVANEVVNA